MGEDEFTLEAPTPEAPVARGIGGHERGYIGSTNDWLTPPEIVRALGPFDLDPCASANQRLAHSRAAVRASD